MTSHVGLDVSLPRHEWIHRAPEQCEDLPARSTAPWMLKRSPRLLGSTATGTSALSNQRGAWRE
jgi:hypothetical protein